MVSAARRSLTAGLTFGLALAALAGMPAPARAQAAAGGASVAADGAGRAALLSERQRVRAELERTNAEIDVLKRAGRNLRDDYRLRARMADAEALARRLTALDARLGAGAGALPVWPATGAEPRGLPTDGPAELEAKADILNDQARRLTDRGDALITRAHDLRARQNLRRRVGQMERDPFSPLEGSKRRAMASGSALSAPPAGAPTGGQGTTTVADTTKGGVPTLSPTVGGEGTGFTSTPPSAPAPVAPPPPSISSNAPRVTAPGGTAVSAAPIAPAPTAVGASETGVTLSVQLRDLLDPTTLAELRRLEAAGGAGGSFEALERAGAALKARAKRLGQDAAALRARAH